MAKSMQDDRIRKRLQREIEGLYGNEALTSDLDDPSARQFLNWAESRIRKIVEKTADLDDQSAEEAMYPKLKAVRRMARYINGAGRGQADQEDLIEKILTQARQIYGSAFQEPDSQQLALLQSVSKSEPSVFLHTLRHIFEGDTDGPEEI
jgi:hypothetical protein